jgi:uncharacterized membrane protein YgdD (TMEM256/DUF423 family)
MNLSLIPLTAMSAAIAVMAGAFGAHGASGKAAEWLRTGGEYQLIHAVAALVAVQLGGRWSPVALLAGSVLFAATLYAMALGAPRWLGAITPIGGVIMIAGWVLLALRR